MTEEPEALQRLIHPVDPEHLAQFFVQLAHGITVVLRVLLHDLSGDEALTAVRECNEVLHRVTGEAIQQVGRPDRSRARATLRIVEGLEVGRLVRHYVWGEAARLSRQLSGPPDAE